MTTKKTVIVYRDDLLGSSETFIRAQAESLDRFEAFYLGLRRLPGLSIPESRSHIAAGKGWLGNLPRLRFKMFGPSTSLQRMLEARNPALVHAHFGPDACNAISLAASLQIPLVVTFHGYDVTVADRHMPNMYVWRQEHLKKAGARFLCVSNFIRDRVIAKGFPASRTHVHYTGIDTHFFTPEPALKRSPIVLFVGRLVVKKGCKYLIRAMARVQEIVPEARLVVIGDGPLRINLQVQAREILKNAQFLGVQSPSEVKNWMNRAKVFCTPSVTSESGDAEGFGMVFAEAQAMGLPVVSFASGGIPEAVAHRQTGLLVAEKDWRALADSIVLLFREPQLWSRFSEAGQVRVKALFDLQKQTHVLEEIYQRVLSESSSVVQQLPVRDIKAATAEEVPAAAMSADTPTL